MGRKREEDGGMVDEPTVVDRIPLNRIGWTRRFFYRDAARSIDRSVNEDRGGWFVATGEFS